MLHWENWTTGAIVAIAVGGVIFRPWGMKEAIPAVAGAVLLVLAGLLPAAAALRGIGQGMDVYLFLAGMMVLAELARDQGLFDWLAAHTARRANGSAKRLFLLVYLMGVLVTVFLSNDATAVVLSPAVAAMARGVRAADPLPYLLICAFVANAASFVLPISNPANLVIYGQHVPKLLTWLRDYALAATLAVVATYLLLRVTQSRALRQDLTLPDSVPVLGQGGRITGGGICGTAVLLLLAAGFGIPLGAPTAFAGFATFAGVCAARRLAPWSILKLEHAAAGRRAVRAGHGTRPRGPGDYPGRVVAARRACGARCHRLGGGPGPRFGRQRHQQPAGRAAGGARAASGGGGVKRDRRRADRRRSRAESLRHRLVGHHPVAAGARPRGRNHHRLAIPETRRADHAACLAAGAIGVSRHNLKWFCFGCLRSGHGTETIYEFIAGLCVYLYLR